MHLVITDRYNDQRHRHERSINDDGVDVKFALKQREADGVTRVKDELYITIIITYVKGQQDDQSHEDPQTDHYNNRSFGRENCSEEFRLSGFDKSINGRE